MTPVRKGDIAVIVTVHSATFAFGSGRGTERRISFHLVKVRSATREGMAKTYRRKGYPYDEALRHNSKLLAIGGDSQAKAQRSFAALETDHEFDSLDAIKAAILAA